MHYRRLRVRLETERHTIEGTLQLPNEGYRSRMTDFLNSHDSDFLPITDARLTRPGDTRAAERHEYLAVSVRHIVRGGRARVAGHVRRDRRAAVGDALRRLEPAARRVTGAACA